jgi:hypothetical protein
MAFKMAAAAAVMWSFQQLDLNDFAGHRRAAPSCSPLHLQ